MSTPLSHLNIGDKGIIKAVNATGEIRRRLLDMGLFTGVRFRVIRIAPLGDPIVIKVRGFDISLRLEEASQILVERIGRTGDGIPMRAYNRLYRPSPIEKRKPSISKSIRVALLGNPNSGKTSLFNEMVGAHQKVGNFTGVTVEKYVGTLRYKGYTIEITDLPGTYSLTAYTPEEIVTRNFIIEEKPDIVVDVVAGSNLERNLYLTTQIMELKVDMLVALNMYDEVEKQGIEIDIPQLEALLGSHVIPTSAFKKMGIESLLDHIVQVFEGEITIAKNKLVFTREIEEEIHRLIKLLEKDDFLSSRYNLNWLAIKLLESDQAVYETVKARSIHVKISRELTDFLNRYKHTGEDDPETTIIEDRHAFIRGALQETVQFPAEIKKTPTDRIDNILLNRILGLPIFFLIMWLMFQFTFSLGTPFMNLIDSFFQFLGNGLGAVLPDNYIKKLIVDGIIAGVGGVLVFLPNILFLFFFIAFLEGSGYMARAAFVIDKVMHKIGLHGKSFIPMITGFGCSVPAIMATRTLKNKGDRITTMMIIPFMSCGAKLPVYILLLSAFFPARIAGNMLFGIYMFGILIAFLSALIIKKAAFKDQSEPFVMELPPYRLPSFKSLMYQMFFKTKMYLKKAGTIILAASVIIWIASNFPVDTKSQNHYKELISQVENNEQLSKEEKDKLVSSYDTQNAAHQLEYSAAGRFGKIITPVIKPLGFDWKIGIALTAGFAAKEVVVSTLSTLYSIGEGENETSQIAQRMKNESGYSKATAMSLIIFVLLYVPCVAATATFHREAGSWKWTRLFILYTMSVAWIFSFIFYRIGLLIW